MPNPSVPPPPPIEHMIGFSVDLFFHWETDGNICNQRRCIGNVWCAEDVKGYRDGVFHSFVLIGTFFINDDFHLAIVGYLSIYLFLPRIMMDIILRYIIFSSFIQIFLDLFI